MIANFGYGLAAAGYLLLLLLLFTVRRSGLAKYLLIIATMTTLLWSMVHISVLVGPLNLERLLLVDTVKQIVWLLFLAAFLRDDFTNLWDVVKRPVSLAILILPCITLILPYAMPVTETWRFLLQTMIALEVLVLLEQVYRQSGAQGWAFKPLVLYLGVLNLFEFVTYANATMVAQIEPLYIAARGYIYLAMIPFLIMATRRIKHWGVDIFISREVVLHSSLLLVAGAYLFVMALIGYAVKFIGGSWGATIQIVLIAMSVALLITLFLSNSFRTRVKVFITKNFFANQFDYRLEWVKLTEVLSVEQDNMADTYNAALQGYLGAINYDRGAILKAEGTQLKLLASRDFDQSILSHDVMLEKLIPFLKQTSWIMDVDEYRIKPYLYSGLNLNQQEQQDLQGIMLVPLFERDNFWGVVVLGCTASKLLRLNWELRDYFSAVNAQISSFIFHHEAANEVAENAQFAAFSRMSAFVVHDLKNVMAQVDLILANAQQHKSNPEFIDDTFETLEYTKARMDKMLAQLTDKQKTHSENRGSYLLSNIINDVISNRCAGLRPLPRLTVLSEVPVVIDAEKFANVVYHLINNAQQATRDSGSIKIKIYADMTQRQQLVEITDDGDGMSDSFIQNRLFKPFDTTKGNAGMGIGAYDARSYLISIQGSLNVESTAGEGSTFTLSIPAN